MEREELVVLGTGNALVTECYNTCFALQGPEGIFLVDTGGGNGILKQLSRAGIALTDKAFWRGALQTVAEQIDLFCQLVEG